MDATRLRELSKELLGNKYGLSHTARFQTRMGPHFLLSPWRMTVVCDIHESKRS